MTQKTIHIAILDEHQPVIDGLISLLQKDEHCQVMITANSPGELFCKMTGQHVDMVLVDDGFLYMHEEELTKMFPKLKIVAMVSVENERSKRMITQKKIAGAIPKNSDEATLVTALEKIADNTYFRDQVLEKMPRVQIPKKESRSWHLTERELEVLKLIEQEYSNKQIAQFLFISERTVETHRKNIFRKTKTTSVIGLIKYAYEHKLV